MANPFIYTPPAGSSSRGFHPIPYVTTYRNWLDQAPTPPFIPDTTSFTSTPLTNSPASFIPSELPSTPYTGPISLPDVDASDNGSSFPTWTDVKRPRSMSWAGVPQPAASLLGSRRSLSAASPTYSTGTPTPWSITHHLPSSPSIHQPALHHYLSAHSPGRLQILYDLALPTFSPMHMASSHGLTSRPALLSSHELIQPATCPSVFRLFITCPILNRAPSFTIELAYHGVGPATPITLGDVLFVLHSRLHERITHRDWTALSDEAKWDVGRAYRTRCANSGTGMERTQRADGVKRVDLMGGRTRFVGLEWVGENRAKLVVT
jgi:hypothetical protein